MSNVCVIRHQGYTKSKAQFPYRHNHRIGENHSNQNIVHSLTDRNTVLLNNLQNNETYLAAFKRLYSDNEFHGQLKVNGEEAKQTKFLDEFLVYPPYEKITAMSIKEQNEFFKKELDVLQSYFPKMILLSAVIHRDEVFHPKDDEMKAMFPNGKVTPHMHIVAIPTVLDKKKGGKKISISELWKGKDSYRKLQDYMYQAVGRDYGFDHGDVHDIGTSKKHQEVEEYKLQEAKKSLEKQQTEIEQKEHELMIRAQEIEPKENINIFNIKQVAKEQRGINMTLKLERDRNISLQQEIDALKNNLQEKEDLIFTREKVIKQYAKKIYELEDLLTQERTFTNRLLNIEISNPQLRELALNDAKSKLKKYDKLEKVIKEILPSLSRTHQQFVQDLVDFDIVSKDDLSSHKYNPYR